MARAMLLLGGNIGDVATRIDRAVELLSERGGCKIVRRSKMLSTEAWGFENSTTAQFTNQAVEISTGLTPEELLDVTQSVEAELGRDRDEEREQKERSGERYASRMIDIDIILYDELILHSERLTLPHPLMQERAFVLEPIVEIAPEWRNATMERSCEELLNELKQRC